MGLIQLIKNYKRLGHKEFFKKFNDGIAQATPEQLAKTELTGHIGTIAGTILAIVFLIIYNLWYVTFALAFGILVSISQAISSWQRLQAIKKLNDHIKELDINKFFEEETNG